MSRIRLSRLIGCAAAAVAASVCLGVANGAGAPGQLTSESFQELHGFIRPQPGESRYFDIPWLLSVREARVKAAAEGKPILLWSGWNGAPVGIC